MPDFDFKKISLLVADSDARMISRVEELFRANGVATIRNATDQATALKLLENWEPDLMMVDLRLDGMNGIPLIRKIRDLAQFQGRDHFFRMPILLTAQAISKHYMREACRAGIEGMLRKPYDEDRLIKIVRMSIQRPRRFVVLKNYFGPERRTGLNPDYNGIERRTAPQRSEIFSPPPANGVWPFEVADAPSLQSPRAKISGGALVDTDEPPKAEPVDNRLPIDDVIDTVTETTPKTTPKPEDPIPETNLPARRPKAELAATDLPARAEKPELAATELPTRAAPAPIPDTELPAITEKEKTPKIEVISQSSPPTEPEPEEKDLEEDAPEEEEQELEEIPLHEALEEHKLWVNTGGREGQQVDFQNADLRGADLERIDLTQSQLRMADFSGGRLMDAVFRKCDLSGSKFISAEMMRANLAVARLSGADFTQANLEHANLLGADLTRANFRGAALRGSNFSGANLNGTDLRGVDLSGAQGLFIDQITRARISRNTRLPQGIKKR